MNQVTSGDGATRSAWDLSKTTGKSGTGHWRFWDRPFEQVAVAAERWAAAVSGVDRPWLCWNMNDRWCIVQQKLVHEFGWTPVIGWDPSCGGPPSTVIPGAIAIDFNADLGLDVLYQHVPLEFAFLWAERLAFWHADLLLSREKMRKACELFESLQSGETAAVKTYGGLRNILRPRYHRYWEVLGCTTRAASLAQFEIGCGWWRGFQEHPNAPRAQSEQARRNRYYDDHGCGIQYWQRFCGGRVRKIDERWIAAEHFSATTLRNYRRGRSKSEEMDLNFDLGSIADKLGIYDLLPSSGQRDD